MSPLLDCASADIERQVAAMGELLVRNGSWIGDGLTVRQRGNDLQLLSAGNDAAHRPILAVSLPCLVPLEDFILRVERDEIVIEAEAKGVTTLRRQLMEHQLAVFNLTDKLATHRRINPAFHYSDHDPLLRHIYGARTQKLAFARQLQAMAPGPRDLEAFFYTRTLKIDLPQRSAPSRVLMPLLDYCNHHPLALPCTPIGPTGGVQAVAIASARLVAGSDETFVNYAHQSDALDIYLNYHFVVPDDATPFVRSAPLTLNLEGVGSIVIGADRPSWHASGSRQESDSPGEALPAFAMAGPGRLLASHLMIDVTGTMQTTRQVLAEFIRRLGGNRDEASVAVLVHSAEQQLLAGNLDFYRTLMRLAREREHAQSASDPIARDCQSLAATQTAKLAGYCARWGLGQ